MTDDTIITDTMKAVTSFDAWADERQYTLTFRGPLKKAFVAGYLAAMQCARERQDGDNDSEAR